MRRRRRRRRRMRRRTSVSPRVINDVGIHTSSKLPLHRPLHRFTSTAGTASLEDNRVKTLKHAKTLFSGFHGHGST
eukprot:218191-Pyramimonas_sp.AAC.1